MNLLITGSEGFIGKNLVTNLRQSGIHNVLGFDQTDDKATLERMLAKADVVYHLAGVNRPQDTNEFEKVNAGLTGLLCELLAKRAAPPAVILASSTQAALDNPYGASKRKAEELVVRYAATTGATVRIYRFTNVFGKWCRPNYNSVVATFCYNIARDLPITISDPARILDLIYIDDVVKALVSDLDRLAGPGVHYCEVEPTNQVTLQRLADLLQGFRRMRDSLVAPDFGDPFIQKLYATYLSYLAHDDFSHPLEKKIDARGCLAEFLKAPSIGQIFVSRTAPGITRGNHYHHTKTEQFLVLEGSALIRFRHVYSGEIIEYPVRGDELRVIDIPPGYTHSIQNVGTNELITLFWASEIFDGKHPDTYALAVIADA